MFKHYEQIHVWVGGGVGFKTRTTRKAGFAQNIKIKIFILTVSLDLESLDREILE